MSRWTGLRKWVIGLFALFGTVLLVGFVWWAVPKSKPAAKVEFPDEGEVESIAVGVNDLRDSLGIPPIPEFDVPPGHIPTILSALTPVEPAERHEYPDLWNQSPVGRVTIKTRAGKVIHVTWCMAGKNPLCFTVDGVRCIRGGQYGPLAVSGSPEFGDYIDEAMLLRSIIEEIKREQVTQEESKRLPQLIEWLKRSKGEIPPRRG